MLSGSKKTELPNIASFTGSQAERLLLIDSSLNHNHHICTAARSEQLPAR